MVSPAPEPIPRELREAFDRALSLYSHWSPALAEPKISAGRKLCTISEVCDLVADYNDPLPLGIFNTLFHQMHMGHERLKEKLGVDASYSIGGYCLLKLIEGRKSEYQRLEELRQNR
jgi:hypothetical protein